MNEEEFNGLCDIRHKSLKLTSSVVMSCVLYTHYGFSTVFWCRF